MSDESIERNEQYVSNIPLIAREWDHSKNDGIKPSMVTITSSSKIWWKCDRGEDHEWRATPYNRIKNGSGCPFCAGQRANLTNNLALTRPELLPSWDYEANDRHPSELMSGSNYLANFKCSKNIDHSWQQSLRLKKIECPHCFAQEKSVFGKAPQLKTEWDFVRNERRSLNPSKITAGSGKKAFWVCAKSSAHRWEAKVSHRVRGSGCPYCAGRLATAESNLLTDAPEVAQEWDPTKNGATLPSEVKAGSGVKRWWICPTGHSYTATPDSRTRSSGGTGCPKCAPSTSSPEIRVYAELSYLFPCAEQRARVNGAELDVWLPSVNVGIEYDGAYWHRNKKESDMRKTQLLERAGVRLIRLRASPLKKTKPYDVLCDGDNVSKNEIQTLLYKLLDLNVITDERVKDYASYSDFVNDEEYRRILSYMPSPVPEKSLSVFVPESIKLWDYQSNHPLVPDNFTPSSNRSVSWRCDLHPDHKWKASINYFQRLRQCPFCAKKRPSTIYNLEITYPEIASEWHPTKNTGLPSEILPNSSKRVWWRCQNNSSHEWETTPNNRVSRGNGCPVCSGRAVGAENNLAKTHPDLLKSWDYSKNKVSPTDLKSGSNKKVYWLCAEFSYHGWETSVANRVKTGCPFCKGVRTHYLDSVQHCAPELLSEFVRFSSSTDQNTALSDLPLTSWRRAKWKCRSCGHEFSGSIKDRSKGKACRKCNPLNLRYTLQSKKPVLASQWHPSKNKKKPDQITNLSDTTEVWWLCDNGHAWQKSIAARCSREMQCPICKQHQEMKVLREEALKYQTRWNFQKQSRNIYLKAQRKGWLDEICSHMIAQKKRAEYWDFKNCQNEAKNHKNRSAFKKSNRLAYKTSLERKWLDRFFPKSLMS